jgi:hypothetical protein
MRVIKANLVLATWLLVSAFLFTRTPATMGIAAIAAIVVAVAAMASGGRPGLRYLNALVGAVLVVMAIMQWEMSGIARLSDLLVGMGLFLLALVSPRHREAEPTAGAAEQPQRA